MRMVMILMLSTDSNPNSKMYPSPTNGYSNDFSTNMVKAARPATPRNITTEEDLLQTDG